MLQPLEQDENYQGNEIVDEKQLIKDFAIHSGAMWGLLSINSITERNFLVPIFSAMLGHGAAGIFKIANDGALLFQRFVIKTIGTTGTSLITHLDDNEKRVASRSAQAKAQHENIDTPNAKAQAGVRDGVWHLTKRIAILIIPLIVIIGIVTMLNSWTPFTVFKNADISRTFLLLTFLYLFQILFLAYDNALEVRRHYKELFTSCIPYIAIGFFYLFSLYTYISVTLISALLIIHALRIASLFIRIYYATNLFLEQITKTN
jgi:hypothetical protein